MASDPTALVEQHLQMMTEVSVENEASVQQALAYVLSAVGEMNQNLAAAQPPTPPHPPLPKPRHHLRCPHRAVTTGTGRPPPSPLRRDLH